MSIEQTPKKPAPGCDRAGSSQYCNGRDVKAVQLRSRTAGPHGPNEYAGAVVMMCSECRKSNCGGFKIVRPAKARA